MVKPCVCVLSEIIIIQICLTEKNYENKNIENGLLKHTDSIGYNF